MTVDLPIIAYRGTLVSVNGHLYSYEISQRGTVKITLKKGKNVIDVSYKVSHLYYGMLIIAGITLIGILLEEFDLGIRKEQMSKIIVLCSNINW